MATRNYFRTPERLHALTDAVQEWIGTPYVGSGAIKRNGASCHRLAGAVLTEAGFEVRPPEKNQTGLRQFTATMEAWLDASPQFSRLPTRSDIQPGDVLLCEYGIGHIALAVGDGGAMQVLRHQPAHIVQLADPNVAKRILVVYRPIEEVPDGQ
jgi:cell wall-associated NlpC family hydrolase